MSTLFSNSTGNFTTAATWSLVDSTSFLDSETNTTNSTTAFVGSQTFSYITPPTIDGIAVKLSSRSASPTGTFSVRLFDGTAVVAGTTVTINVTDILAINGSTNSGWVFFKFAAPVALAAATNYSVQIQTSSNAQVTLYRNATAGNWSRVLRTTTTQAPAATDDLIIAGERTGAGTSNSFTVTMNNTTSATTFGSIQICGKGTLDWGTAASTNYYLKMLGALTIYTNGIYQQGTVSVPMPSTSTAKLEFANTSNVQFGIEARLGSTLKSGGAVITNTAFLAANAAVSATSLTTDVSTGWKSGDVIALASTTRTRTECESKVLTANAAGTTLTITALTNAHGGAAPTRAELANLTRNVQIFGISTTFQAYINVLGTSIVDLQSTEFYNLGSATTAKRGFNLGTTTGSATVNNCSFHDFVVASSIGIFPDSGTGNNFTISNNVFYNIERTGIFTTGTTGTNYSITNNLVILTNNVGIDINDLGGTFNNLTAVGSATNGINLAEIGFIPAVVNSNFTAHSNTGPGINITNLTGAANNPMASLTNFSTWRNTTTGITINNVFDCILDTISAFGNGTSNLSFTGSTGNMFFRNLTSSSDVTFPTPIGVGITSDIKDVYIDNGIFGPLGLTHSTGDISITAANIYPKVYFRNCLFNSTTTLANVGNLVEGGFVASARHNQTSGNHRMFKKYGTTVPDTVIFNRASPSSRMTPSSAIQKLNGGIKKFAVPSGQTATVSVNVRKSVVGDGSAYNGTQPRLILLADPAVGINSDQVLATASGASGTFEKLTALTPTITDNAVFQVYIDCDGTSGWVNVDDWSVY